MLAFPIPVMGETSPLIAILFGLAALTGFGVLVWQAVRYFRQNGDDDSDDRG